MSSENTTNAPLTEESENQLITQRREKLQAIREKGTAFPNDFAPHDNAAAIHQEYDGHDKQWFEDNVVTVSVAGRMMLKRVMGKASFVTIADSTGQVQLYAKKELLGDEIYDDFTHFDIGDIVGATGQLFKTNKGELSVKLDTMRLLTKSLRPLPEKFHGLTDSEQKYRQRYLDLIMNQDTRETFKTRSKIIYFIRQFFDERGFLEVETPMLQVIPGGAAAKPFETHHNALDIDMYLRIAPELYLKRLIVGGFDRVFEVNRNFRNEGLSTRHNPEFTMIEFYQAYADYHMLMDITETLMRELAEYLNDGSALVQSGEETYDFSQPFARMTVKESILHFNKDLTEADLDTEYRAQKTCEALEIPYMESYGLGKLQIEIFEKTVEDRLLQPTFITEYPAEVSPLARRKDGDEFVTDRFEFFIGGREIGNGFSELNDAEDQAERFMQQVQDKDAGDEEAMHYDADYVRALEYGMPPTAGEGIGIDRLVMVFTGAASIKDVILFPHMRPEAD